MKNFSNISYDFKQEKEVLRPRHEIEGVEGVTGLERSSKAKGSRFKAEKFFGLVWIMFEIFFSVANMYGA